MNKDKDIGWPRVLTTLACFIMRRASRIVVSQVAKGNSSAKGHTGSLAFMLAKVGNYSIKKQKNANRSFSGPLRFVFR
jgi:ascorbate-specific PTS system EIIC-type component UlaA